MNEEIIGSITVQIAQVLSEFLTKAASIYKEQFKTVDNDFQISIAFKPVPNERSLSSYKYSTEDFNRSSRIATSILSGFDVYKDYQIETICKQIWEASRGRMSNPMPVGNLRSDFYVLMLHSVEKYVVRNELDDFHNVTEPLARNFVLHHLGHPVRYIMRMYCSRVWVDNSFDLLHGVRIRPATKHDALHYMELLVNQAGTTLSPFSEIDWLTSVIEIEKECNNVWDINRDCHRLIFSLSLFRPFQLNTVHADVECSDLSDSSHSCWITLIEGKQNKSNWTLGEEETISLKEFLEKINGYEVPDLFHPQGARRFKRLYITCKHYVDSYTDGYLFERMASCVAGIESLILPNETELKHRMRLHVAKLLSFVDSNEYEPMKSYDNLGHAYDMRSTYVHGSGPEESAYPEHFHKEIAESNDPVVVIADYLRVLIILFLVKHKSKEELTVLLDRSLLSEEYADELREEFSEGIDLAKITLSKSRRILLDGVSMMIKSLGPDWSEYRSDRDRKIKP